MKKLFCLLVLAPILAPGGIRAQGTIDFGNDSSSLVLYPSGEPVRAADGIVAALYYAPEGTTNPANFSLLGAPVQIGVAPPIPGIFRGGLRITPPTTQPSQTAMFQVRAWELAFGTTYSQAFFAPPINGRSAILGTSEIVRVKTGGDLSVPVPPGVLNSVLTSFQMNNFPGTFLNIADVVVAEGPVGIVMATFQLSLSVTSATPVQVNFSTADGSARAGVDYVQTNGSVTFAPGQLQQVVTVAVVADEPVEPDETFHLHISSTSNVFVGRTRATCTITQAFISAVRVDTSVNFNTLLNQFYALEHSTDLTNWNKVFGAQRIRGTGNVMTVVDLGSGCHALRHYRLLVVP